MKVIDNLSILDRFVNAMEREAGKREDMARLYKYFVTVAGVDAGTPAQSVTQVRYQNLHDVSPKFVSVLVHWYVNSEYGAFDISSAIELIDNYEANFDKIPPEFRNLANFKTIPEAANTLSQFFPKAPVDTEEALRVKAISEKYPQSLKKIGDFGEYTVYQIDDSAGLNNAVSASTIMGKDQTWCIGNSRNYAGQYLARGPVHYIFKNGEHVYAAAIDDSGDWDLYDTANNRIEFRANHPNISDDDKIMAQIQNHLKESEDVSSAIDNFEPGYVCDNCGNPISDDETNSGVNGEGTYCEECWRNEFFGCERCGETCSLDELAGGTRNAEFLCEDCFDKSYYRCEHCGNAVEHDDAIVYNDSIYCVRCAPRYVPECGNCGDLMHDGVGANDVVVGSDDNAGLKPMIEPWCDNCFNDNNCSQCKECGNFVVHDDAIAGGSMWSQHFKGVCITCENKAKPDPLPLQMYDELESINIAQAKRKFYIRRVI